MVRKKSLNRGIIVTLFLAVVIPVLIMVVGSYATTRQLLIQRNNVANQAAATNFVDQRLPQTGETDQQHMTLSGLLLLAMSSLLGLFGMTKRQRKE